LTGLKAVRSSVFTALQSDTLLSSHGCLGVFLDGSIEDQPLPYISMGSDTYIPWDSFIPKGFDATVILDIWDFIYQGDRYFDLEDDIYRILDKPATPIVIDGYANVKTECEWETVQNDPDNETRHVTVRVRIYAQKL